MHIHLQNLTATAVGIKDMKKKEKKMELSRFLSLSSVSSLFCRSLQRVKNECKFKAATAMFVNQHEKKGREKNSN